MTPYAVWPGIFMILFICALAWVFVGIVPSFRVQIAEDQSKPRLYPQLEGLRGILSVGVFVHHAVIFFFVLPQLGKWAYPPSIFYSELADAPVLLFFFLTGFLFWSKLLRKPRLPILPHLQGRLRRLGPVYGVAMVWFFTLVAIKSKFALQTSVLNLGKSSLEWLLFSFPGRPEINGLTNTWYLIAGTPWTLAFEWQFYLLLPFIPWFARKRYRLLYILFLAGTIFALTTENCFNNVLSHGHLTNKLHYFAGHLLFSFGIGMSVATVHSRIKQPTSAVYATLLSCASFVAVAWLLLDHPSGFFDPTSSLVLGLVFLTIVCGNTFWGVLESRPLLLLGKCSYSLYLCHGLMLASLTMFLRMHFDLGKLSTASSWGLIALSGLLVLGAALACYAFVEAPSMEKKPQASHSRKPVTLTEST